MTLIHLLCRMREYIPMALYVVHIDHGIRGEAAKEDALFVETMATEWGLIFSEGDLRAKAGQGMGPVGGAGRAEGQA